MKNFFLRDDVGYETVWAARTAALPPEGSAARCLTFAYLYKAFANRFCAIHMPVTHSAMR